MPSVGPIDLVVQGLDPLSADSTYPLPGPYVGPAGHLFIFANTAAGDGKIHAWRSTDTGNTWAEVDAANAPAYLSGAGFAAQHIPILKPGSTTRVCVIYITSAPTLASPADPFTVLVKEFDLATETWVAGTYGGNLPYTYPAVVNEQANLFGAVSRSTDIVLLANTTSGATSLQQLMLLTLVPGGAWSAAINAAPGFGALRVDALVATLAATPNDSVYYAFSDLDTLNNPFYQGILNAANVVSTVLIDNQTIATGFYGIPRYTCSPGGQVYLAIPFIPLLGNEVILLGTAAQGGNIVVPFNIGAPNADSVSVSLTYANGSIVFFYQTSTNAPFYATINPVTAPTVVSAPIDATTLFAGVGTPSFVAPIDASNISAISFLQPIGAAHANFWASPFGAGPGPGPGVALTTRMMDAMACGSIAFPFVVSCCRQCDMNPPMQRGKVVYASFEFEY